MGDGGAVARSSGQICGRSQENRDSCAPEQGTRACMHLQGGDEKVWRRTPTNARDGPMDRPNREKGTLESK